MAMSLTMMGAVLVNELDDILARASAAIEEKFFRLPIDGGEPVFRERVYCYELYHQMRVLWTSNEFTLNGEVDKRGHALLRRLGLRLASPDFLIHSPGSMNGNHAVIEVKHTLAADDIEKDLQTLRSFVAVAGYARAIYLVFGCPDTQKVITKIASVNATLDEHHVPVELWLHESIGTSARCCYVLTPSVDRGPAAKEKTGEHFPSVSTRRPRRKTAY